MSNNKKPERLEVDLFKMQFKGNSNGRNNRINLILLLVFYVLLFLIAAGVIIYILIYVLKNGYVLHLAGGASSLMLARKAAQWIKGKGP